MIIYKSLGEFRCTSKENYYAFIQDARKIQKLKDFESPEQIIEYYCKYCGCKPTDFEVLC